MVLCYFVLLVAAADAVSASVAASHLSIRQPTEVGGNGASAVGGWTVTWGGGRGSVHGNDRRLSLIDSDGKREGLSHGRWESGGSAD